MARTVKDAAILLAALAGVDASDAVTRQSEGKALKDYTISLSTDGLKGKRIGIEKSQFEGPEAVVALYKIAIDVLKQQGAEVIEVSLFEKTKIWVKQSLKYCCMNLKMG